MNKSIYLNSIKRLLYKIKAQARLLDTNTTSDYFADNHVTDVIQRIYVINLDRKPDRWRQVSRELKRIKCHSKSSLLSISRRFSATDARYLDSEINNNLLCPYFSLDDQLQVEPNPLVKRDAYSKAYRIDMSPQEIAIALSHIEVWKLVASNNIPYTLILEDDVYFQYGFARKFDAAWQSVVSQSAKDSTFDILFLSFQEVGENLNIKVQQTGLVHRPDRGIWQASGYVLSVKGARALLSLLPVYGPVDLWLNLQFDKLNVFLTKHPIIEQRVDVPSTNSYSVMPVFSQIGVFTSEKPLVTAKRKLLEPVFAFGAIGSGLTALATALSILGYTCCSDITELPIMEYNKLIKKKRGRLFNAYVNVGSLYNWPREDIVKVYPNARIIYTTLDDACISTIHDSRVLYLPNNHKDKWEALSAFLECEYPTSQYPQHEDLGLQCADPNNVCSKELFLYKELKFDNSPWIVSAKNWKGIAIRPQEIVPPENNLVAIWHGKKSFQEYFWKRRDDTFPSNLSIFSPDNITIDRQEVTRLSFREQSTAVRTFTSAALASVQKISYGKFAITLKPTDVSGLITGVFLHRNSPHQEIDIEFLGKNTTKMLVNVFYNPGTEGTKLEYGYRGTPVLIDIGFDAAKDFHKYEIEWCEKHIRWFVDEHLVYERIQWDPTPIPNLPMEFNVNIWHSRSKELVGELDRTRIPTYSEINSIQIFRYQ